uniref:(northern house mosquito) hypothetical protein n=1 Tax=Culex pipiens TaxID=7175 RepID=A0A8D8EXB3_CULPI
MLGVTFLRTGGHPCNELISKSTSPIGCGRQSFIKYFTICWSPEPDIFSTQISQLQTNNRRCCTKRCRFPMTSNVLEIPTRNDLVVWKKSSSAAEGLLHHNGYMFR